MNPIAFLFMIIAAAGLTPLLYAAISSQGQQEQATVAAMQMARIDKAAQGYITANAAAVEAASTATTPAIITVPMLVNTGYLPNGFNANNPYGQIWEVQVLQPAANQLQALVVSQGGQTVDAKQAGMVAQEAGSTGGVIGGGTGKFAVPGCNAGAACGVYAGWDVSTNGYQNVAPGHLAALIEYSNGQLQSDYLYRTAVPGQPQLNTMQTNLNMGANNINNAQNVNVNQNVEAGPAGQCVPDADNHCTGEIEAAGTTEADFPAGWLGGMTTRDLKAEDSIAAGPPGQVQAYMTDYGSGTKDSGGQVLVTDPSDGGYAAMNSTSTGSLPEIYTNGIVDAGNGFGAGNYYAMYNGSWWANNAGDSSQSGNAYVGGQVTANYDATLGTAGGSANIGWGCSPNGAIAANANGSGQVLACQGGSWQAMGGNNTPLQMYSEDLPSGQIFPGQWQFCAVTDGFDAWVDIYPIAGPYLNGTYTWGTGAGHNGDATIFTCYNLPGVYVPSNP